MLIKNGTELGRKALTVLMVMTMAFTIIPMMGRPSYANRAYFLWIGGVKVTVMIPKKANVSDDITHKTMSILFRHAMETNADFTVYLHPGMPHTKLLMNESEISLGSCNITRNAFGDLSELNYFAANDDSQFAIDVRESAAALLGECERAKSLDDLSCSPLRAAMEGITL